MAAAGIKLLQSVPFHPPDYSDWSCWNLTWRPLSSLLFRAHMSSSYMKHAYVSRLDSPPLGELDPSLASLITFIPFLGFLGSIFLLYPILFFFFKEKALPELFSPRNQICDAQSCTYFYQSSACPLAPGKPREMVGLRFVRLQLCPLQIYLLCGYPSMVLSWPPSGATLARLWWQLSPQMSLCHLPPCFLWPIVWTVVYSWVSSHSSSDLEPRSKLRFQIWWGESGGGAGMW